MLLMFRPWNFTEKATRSRVKISISWNYTLLLLLLLPCKVRIEKDWLWYEVMFVRVHRGPCNLCSFTYTRQFRSIPLCSLSGKAHEKCSCLINSVWFQYLFQLRSLSTSTDKWSSINNECHILSTPFPLLGNNLQLSGIVFFFFFLTLFNFNIFRSTFDIKTGVNNVYFNLLHYFLYMSLHNFVIPRCGYFIKF